MCGLRGGTALDSVGDVAAHLSRKELHNYDGKPFVHHRGLAQTGLEIRPAHIPDIGVGFEVSEDSLLRARRTLNWLGVFFAAGLMTALAGPASAQSVQRSQSASTSMSSDWWACIEAAHEAEAMRQMPDRLLTAIALTESGRRTPNRAVAPWPWTINVGGRGYRYATKDQAMAAARNLLATGRRSFDVGCMQINMMYHPRAFTSFEEAFDPLANVLYAADFISRLQSSNRSWDRAIQLYHSYNEEFNQIYGERVQVAWNTARRRAARGDILMNPRPASEVTNDVDMATLPDGFGPDARGGTHQQDLDIRTTSLSADMSASINGSRLARAVDNARFSRDAELRALAPMSVALMMGKAAPAASPALYQPDTTRTPAILRRLQQNTAPDEVEG